MAAIKDVTSCHKDVTFLTSHHYLGRSIANADTVVGSMEVSRVHASIEWSGDYWLVRDVSTNGTWVNQKKLSKGEFCQVRLGDKIYLGSHTGYCFELIDDSDPKNMLIPVGPSYCESCPKPIILGDCNYLPSKEDSEVSVFFVASFA